MRSHLDDELPDPLPLPNPRGWFELFCCSTILLLLVAFIVLLAVVRR